MNGAVALHSCTSSSSSGLTSSTFWVQEFSVWRSGQQPAGVDRRTCQVRVQRCVAGGQGQRGHRGGGLVVSRRSQSASSTQGFRDGRRATSSTTGASWWATAWCCRVPAMAAGCASLIRSKVSSSGRATSSGSGADSSSTSRLYAPGRAPYGLGGVVDQDVERSGGCDVVGQRDDLGRVPKVDADDLEPLDPLGAVLQRGEPAYGVLREPGRDRRVGAVAQQAQGDVHADLGATAREQRPPTGEVGALVPLGVGEGGAARAQPVVERVDQRVVVLADVAAARVDQLTREGTACRGHQRDAPGLVVDPQRRTRGGCLGDRAIGGKLGLALCGYDAPV